MQTNRHLDNLTKGFKSIQPVSPERVEAMAQDGLKCNPFTMLEKGPSKINGKFVKVKWTLHYLWNDMEPDTFTSEEMARGAQEAYEVQHAADKLDYTTRTLETLRASARLSLQAQRDAEIKSLTNAVARVTAHDARKALSRM